MMKQLSLIAGLLIACSTAFSQNRENEKVTVKYVQLPMKPMVGVQTYNCKLDAAELFAKMPDAKYDWALTDDYTKGLFALQGLTYSNTNADATLTLVANQVSIQSFKIVNLASEGSTANFKMIFKVKADWRVNVSGKVQDELQVNGEAGEIDVRFPADYDKFGLPAPAVATADILEKSYAAKKSDIDKYVIESAVSSTVNKASNLVESNYSFKPVVKTLEISSFKTNKKFDATQWEKATTTALSALKGLTSGQSTSATLEKGKEAVDFWAAQFDQLKGDVKTNDKLLEAATKNLITFLSLTNPQLIKEEYGTILDKVAPFDYEDLMKWATPTGKRVEANKQSVDFAALANVPALKEDRYEAVATLKTGEKFPVVVSFSSPYYYNPYELSAGFKMYKTADYNSAMGSTNSKIEIDLKTVASYEMLGKVYEAVKYTDPTVVSLSGTEEFMEKIYDGAAPLYKKYTLSVENGQAMVMGAGSANYSATDLANSRKNPQLLIQKGKKTTVIFNYSKLADFMSDCPAVAEKIKSGAYGNKPIEAKTSKLGSFIEKGLLNEISEEILLKIFTDYNSQMKG